MLGADDDGGAVGNSDEGEEGEENEGPTAGNWEGAGPGAFGPAWLQRELAAAATWQRVMREGYGALTLPLALDAGTMPRELARSLGALGVPTHRSGRLGGAGRARMAANGNLAAERTRWASLAQLSVLCGLHRALYLGAVGPEPPEEDTPLAGIRCGAGAWGWQGLFWCEAGSALLAGQRAFVLRALGAPHRLMLLKIPTITSRNPSHP
jgi:hypothetical protein